ncbi:BMP family protein [Ilumatobacter nonamiensis]|uniref:BMP family protein n=1 Tax=Ilumatobacter nonamiensis TaxID=467093 RepID=UPI00034BD0F8|nr:BMP family protein [Ilumatobacter nonamiensis]
MRIRTTPKTAVALVAGLALVAGACGSDDDSSDSADDAEEAVDEAEETLDSVADEAEEAVDTAVDDTEEATENSAAEETDEAAGDGETIRVGIVAPSASNDLAFTQSMVDSVERVEAERDLEVAITDGTFVVEDAAAAIRGYAEDGFDLVIAHGSQYGGPLEEIAPDFPEVSFAWGTSVDTFGLDNVYAYTTNADLGGYVNGVMAAQLTESDVIGVVGPVEVGDAKLYVDGFSNGVAATNPDVTVNVNYIESFSDVALASEAATSLVANGADILTGTAQMVVGATGVATESGLPWFGTQSNQTPLGEDIVVASQVYHWEIVLNQMLDSLEGGTLGGETYTLTFENGGLEMEYNDAFELDEAVRASADEAVAGLTDGSLTTGVTE